MTTAGKRNPANPKPPTRWSLDRVVLLVAGMLAFMGCKTLPEVPITTPKPLEVNLNMRLDVYQYRGDEPRDKEATKNAGEATQRMRNRMQEIQTLKNNQLVGEDHRGLLLIREVPEGEWGQQLKKAVAAENADRTLLMRHKAKESNRTLHEVEAEQWRLRTQQANTGEWIEVPGSSPGSFQWKRAGTGEAEADAGTKPPPAATPSSAIDTSPQPQPLSPPKP